MSHGAKAHLTRTAPVVHRTTRWTSWGHGLEKWEFPSGMKSVSVSVPVSVVKRVTSTLVSRMYSWLEVAPESAGEIRKLPPRSPSKMAANTLGESNLGNQHQSMEPSVPTSAAEFMSPIRPYWSRGLYFIRDGPAPNAAPNGALFPNRDLLPWLSAKSTRWRV